MNNIISGIKSNKKVIIKKGLVIAGTLIGLAIVDALRSPKIESDYNDEFETDTEDNDDELVYTTQEEA